MKAIIISIKPKYVSKILTGEKKLEIRKSIPKCDLPIDVYIYCTKDKKYANLINRGGFLTGMVVAKFTLYETEEIKWENCPFHEHWEYTTDSMWEEHILDESGLTFMELYNYLCNSKGYVWYIEKLEIFDKPKEISEFFTAMGTHKPSYMLEKAPQSWCYIEL